LYAVVAAGWWLADPSREEIARRIAPECVGDPRPLPRHFQGQAQRSSPAGRRRVPLV